MEETIEKKNASTRDLWRNAGNKVAEHAVTQQKKAAEALFAALSTEPIPSWAWLGQCRKQPTGLQWKKRRDPPGGCG